MEFYLSVASVGILGATLIISSVFTWKAYRQSQKQHEVQKKMSSEQHTFQKEISAKQHEFQKEMMELKTIFYFHDKIYKQFGPIILDACKDITQNETNISNENKAEIILLFLTYNDIANMILEKKFSLETFFTVHKTTLLVLCEHLSFMKIYDHFIKNAIEDKRDIEYRPIGTIINEFRKYMKKIQSTDLISPEG